MKTLLIGALFGLSFVTFSASAASVKYETKIIRTSLDDYRYAGCMAEVCSGELGSSSGESSKKYSAAQLALVTGNKVLVTVTNTRSANGVCYVDRIDNYNIP